mmetsp:Transcript_73183/g.190618  ORF Transcript_73183/g.190618 Transcript_73183/m.190618 type:complete len:216 (-) Transcript_73183:410-1057(-)
MVAATTAGQSRRLCPLPSRLHRQMTTTMAHPPSRTRHRLPPGHVSHLGCHLLATSFLRSVSFALDRSRRWLSCCSIRTGDLHCLVQRTFVAARLPSRRRNRLSSTAAGRLVGTAVGRLVGTVPSLPPRRYGRRHRRRRLLPHPLPPLPLFRSLPRTRPARGKEPRRPDEPAAGRHRQSQPIARRRVLQPPRCPRSSCGRGHGGGRCPTATAWPSV